MPGDVVLSFAFIAVNRVAFIVSEFPRILHDFSTMWADRVVAVFGV
jgi:hypothetical protein